MQEMKILIVESDTSLAREIKKILNSMDLSVCSIATSGNEALIKAEKKSPDLVLIDTVLDNKSSGVEAARQILKRFDIPIVYIASKSDKKTIDAANKTDPFGYVFLPINEKQLHAAIEIAIHKHKYERELKEREQRLTQFMNADTDSLCLVDSNFKILEVNDSGLENWDLSKKNTIGKYLLDFIPKSERKKWRDLLQEVMDTGKPFSAYSIAAPSRFGKRYVNVNFIKAGDGLGIIVTEITSQRKAEIALQESKEHYKQLVENINEGIFMQDRNGIITYVNEKFLDMVGYKKDEVLGHNSSEFLGERLLKENKRQKPEHWEPFEFEWRRKDGRKIFTILSPKPICDEKGKLKGSVSVLTDITDRREVEQKLDQSREQLRKLSQYLQSVREKESKRIAREIHDELGQKLTALKMDLSWMSSRIPYKTEEQKTFHQKTKSMSELIDDTIQTVQKISAELRPGLLDDLGLVPAIEWLTQDFQERTNIQCRMRVNCNELELGPDLSTAIFRISQEALTNVARHAKATRVNISLSEKAQSLELKIRDNGKGIKEEDILSPSSLGLMGIRERLRPFSGTLKIDGRPKRGTTLTVILPMKEK